MRSKRNKKITKWTDKIRKIMEAEKILVKEERERERSNEERKHAEAR